MWYWIKTETQNQGRDTSKAQNGEQITSLETDPSIHGNHISVKEKSKQMVLSTICVGTICIYMQKINLLSTTYFLYKHYFKMDHRPKCETYNFKISKRKHTRISL